MKFDRAHLSTSPEADVLVVLLHGYTCERRHMRTIEVAAKDRFGDADVYRPTLPLSLLSMRHPDEIVAALLTHIDHIWAEKKGGYKKLVLVGHSMGALLARKLYVCACGQTDIAPFDEQFSKFGASVAEARPRAGCVDRLVLLAGMNRGWQVSHHLSLRWAAWWLLGLFFCRVSMLFGREPVIMHIKRGACFLTELRVLWIHMQERAHPSPEYKDGKPVTPPERPPGKPPVGGALTVQLLGSIDDMVSPEDNIDLISGKNFIYLDMPYSSHMSAIELSNAKPDPASERLSARQMRTEVFQAALGDDKSVLNHRAVIPSDDMQPAKADSCVTDVIFVIHGIRDRGYWTHKVARRVLKAAKDKKMSVKLATETSSYGYFPMLSFMLPWRRRAKVEWLMDQYAEALALYPRAKFSFIGHSNGTYLLAKALQDYPLCKFKNVIFAGSVVKRQYDWAKIAQRQQVERVTNFTASSDLVVGLIPKVFQILPIQDLGSAGHDGFHPTAESRGFLRQRRYYGGHSAALHEDNWDAIADVILEGDSDRYPADRTPAKIASFSLLASKLSLVIVLLVLNFLGWLSFGIWGLETIPEWRRTVYLMILWFSVYKIITKF